MAVVSPTSAGSYMEINKVATYRVAPGDEVFAVYWPYAPAAAMVGAEEVARSRPGWSFQ